MCALISSNFVQLLCKVNNTRFLRCQTPVTRINEPRREKTCQDFQPGVTKMVCTATEDS